MRTSELRERYLGFFAAHDHTILPSSSLVPKDPTLLFTSAGMVQFKDIFWGLVDPQHPRVTTCQKCFRTTDIENVGRTAHHNTFFEMLGNFSFGDYFKQGAIEMAWEFLTKELGVPGERLTAAVYEEDDDAYAMWRDVVGLPTHRIVRLGKEHNWWGPVGDTGPCGPDSEIHFDAGEDLACGPDCLGPACECDRFSEIWNLVFIQYDAKEDGSFVPLKRQSIDTGMGLERTTAVLQGAPSVFDIDVFRPIIEAIEAKALRPTEGEDRVHRNTIADHIRAVLLLLADGVMPGNEKQGYVSRRILRRAIRAGEKLELPAGSLAGFIDPAIDSLGGVYPEIVGARELGHRLIEREEETFRRTLRDGERRLSKLLDDLAESGSSILPGELAFELTDTYGFPMEMTREIADERGIAVDLAGFENALQSQRSQSRVNIKAVTSVTATPPVIRGWHRQVTPFAGYSTDQADAEVVGFEPDDLHVGFSLTPFFAAAGGQVGDSGTIENRSKRFTVRVRNTTRHPEGATLHHIEEPGLGFEKGDTCRLTVDAERRRRIERNHTATHILHAALREVLGPHATQAGSEVNDRELRFDFSHFEKMTGDEIARVQEIANAAVLADHPVTVQELSLEEAKASEAIGLFEDEYRGHESVRVVCVGEVSKELCGGTHVRRSGEIGLIKIVSEESVASGIRRIRAMTGDAVLARLREQDVFADRMKSALGDDPEQGVQRLKDQIVELSSRLDAAGADQVRSAAENLLGGAETVSEFQFVSGRADIGADELKGLADLLEDRTRPSVIVLVGDSGGRGIAICKVSKEVQGVKAGDIVRKMSKILGGGGGGGRRFAQGGGPDISKLDDALAAGAKEAKSTLS